MSQIEDQNEVVLSPCVGICSLDENDVCVGCFRSGDEINQWWQEDNAGKRSILQNVELRLKESV